MLTSDQCRIARGGLGLTRDELAELAHVSKRTIVDFENGTRSPIHATRAALMRVLVERGVVFNVDTVLIPLPQSDLK